MEKFWKNGKRSQQGQRLLPIYEHRVFAAVVYKAPWELPSLCRQMLSLPFSRGGTRGHILVGGKTILPDSDTRIRHRARGDPLGRSNSPCMCHVWDVVFSHRGGSLDLVT